MFYLAWRNIVRRSGQSLVTALVILISVFVVVVSNIMVSTLERGVSLARDRLGADVMVLPTGASTNASEVLFTAQPVNVYLPQETIGQVAGVAGVAGVTPQFFTQTVDQSCCSIMGVTRVVGIDLATDFVIKPWIVESGVDRLESDMILVGSAAPSIQGDQVSILGSVFHVASALEETGTSVDKTIFMDIDAARTIAANSPYLEGVWNGIDPYTSVSCIMVDLAPGADPAAAAREIMSTCPGAVAVVASELIAGVSSQFGAIETVSAALLVMLLVIAMLALAGRFSALAAARTKELGLMRTMGVDKKGILLSLALETGLITLAGSVVGALLGCIVSYLLTGSIHEVFSLPGSSPSAGSYVVSALAGLALAIVFNALALVQPVLKIVRTDPQQTLARGDLQ